MASGRTPAATGLGREGIADTAKDGKETATKMAFYPTLSMVMTVLLKEQACLSARPEGRGPDAGRPGRHCASYFFCQPNVLCAGRMLIDLL